MTDLGLELELGVEKQEVLTGDRVKTILATSDNPGKDVRIISQMPTMNGLATVIDTKVLQREESGTLLLVQTLVIKNERSGKEHVSIFYLYLSWSMSYLYLFPYDIIFPSSTAYVDNSKNICATSGRGSPSRGDSKRNIGYWI